ncbi:hypothetical protein AB0F45_34880, partial [Streptomyces achromogenes]|uniref:hypothetical protein n=1 Tax=Streptomyces achromogenes TaxID=67255 RepID=UPI0033CC24B6
GTVGAAAAVIPGFQVNRTGTPGGKSLPRTEVTAVPFPPVAAGEFRIPSEEFRARTGLMGCCPGEMDCDHPAKGTRSTPGHRPMTAKITDRGEARSLGRHHADDRTTCRKDKCVDRE